MLTEAADVAAVVAVVVGALGGTTCGFVLGAGWALFTVFAAEVGAVTGFVVLVAGAWVLGLSEVVVVG